MKVSVIVPNYNHAKYLRERIESILCQTYKDFELIILDDASADNSREIILEYTCRNPQIITCFNEQNSGSPFRQWNKGVGFAKGEYVWIAESDDFAEPDFLKKSIAELMKSDKIGLVFSDTIVFDEQRRIKYLFSDKKKTNDNVELLTLKSFVRNPIPNVSSVLFRKSEYFKAGGANTSMKFCGDWLLYLKIRKNSAISYFPEPLSTFRLHEKSQYHQHFSTNEFLKEKFKIYKYIIKASWSSPTILLLVLKDIIISMGLRVINFIEFPSSLITERPRAPRKFRYI